MVLIEIERESNNVGSFTMGSSCGKQEEIIATKFFNSELKKVELYRARIVKSSSLGLWSGLRGQPGSLVLTTNKVS